MRTVVVAMVVAGALAAGAANAQSGADVVKSKGCVNCHEMDKKKVGPSFKDIAAKGKGKEAEMAAKIKEGKGHPKVAASDAEIKAALDYIMAAK
ncbi:MAG TPA: c-type cytochrome [Burkholderiales bacterium]|nr:c-type cytochrome [Burkholderiales bacterium]